MSECPSICCLGMKLAYDYFRIQVKVGMSIRPKPYLIHDAYTTSQIRLCGLALCRYSLLRRLRILLLPGETIRELSEDHVKLSQGQAHPVDRLQADSDRALVGYPLFTSYIFRRLPRFSYCVPFIERRLFFLVVVPFSIIHEMYIIVSSFFSTCFLQYPMPMGLRHAQLWIQRTNCPKVNVRSIRYQCLYCIRKRVKRRGSVSLLFNPVSITTLSLVLHRIFWVSYFFSSQPWTLALDTEARLHGP